MKYHILKYFYLLLLPLLMGCSSDDEPSSPKIPTDAVYDFVTLHSSGENGSVFTLQKNGDSPVISYYSDIDFSSVKSINDGDRLILCYKPENGAVYTTGKVKVYGYVRLSNTEKNLLAASAADFNNWNTSPLKINSIWRTGQYINIDADIFVYKAADPQMMAMICDKATLASAMPEIHLVYINAEDNNGDNPYTVYASVDISSLWDLPTCEGVNVVYHSPSGVQSVIFEKQNNSDL